MKIALPKELTAKELLAKGLAGIRLGGDFAQSVAMIRAAPLRARSRSDRVAMAIVAAQNDQEVLSWAKTAQFSAHSGGFEEAQYHYWKCTEVYPSHPNYSFKYSEVLFKQRKFLEAESGLRDALALGAKGDICTELIRSCLTEQGLPAAPADLKLENSLASAALESLSPTAKSDANLYPDLYTIRAFSRLLIDESEPSLSIRISLQRTAWDAESLLCAFVDLPEFRYRNLKLLLVLKSRIAEGVL